LGGERVMKTFEIYITYVSWGEDGKSRPVLVSELHENKVVLYPITTKYDKKSPAIRANYYPIKKWHEAGLHQKSYVDTGTEITYPQSAIVSPPIGKLTEHDKKALLDFMKKN
jgi:hypothetical protein